MFFSNKYKWLAVNSSFIFVSYLQRKKLQERLHLAEDNLPFNIKHKNVFFSNMNPEEYKSQLKYDEILLNYKKKISEYRQAAIFEDLSDLFEFTNQKIIDPNQKNENKQNQKIYLEEAIYVGNENDIPNRGFIQINVGKMRRIQDDESGKDPYENKTEDDILLEDPFNYFQKLLVFKLGHNYHAMGSFCSYDLTDLKDSILLGDKIICPHCLSEYNITDGSVESGLANRNLAYFPVSLRNEKVFVRIPLKKIPVFSNPISADNNNELDPRHIVLIGDTETVVGAVNTLRLFFTGKISIITNKSDLHFIDLNKLTKSLFPLRAKHARFFDNKMLDEMGINVYDEKVHYIDGEKRIISLKNKMKIPFDKVLIAVGSERQKLNKSYNNVFTLQNIQDHANIHNAIIKKDVKSIAIIGENLKSIEIASSIRRYMDALGREDVNISIVSEKKNIIEEYCGLEAMKIVQDYLKRNRIFVFKANDFELEHVKSINEQPNNIGELTDGEFSQNELNTRNTQMSKTLSKEPDNVISLIIKGDKYVFKLPVDVLVYEKGLSDSKCDFSEKILITEDLNRKPAMDYPNIFLPDERLSLNEGKRYPLMFTAGSCAMMESKAMYHSKLRTDNVRTNYQLGFFSVISMFEFHYPYDDVVVDNCKILDKNLFYIGIDPMIDEKITNIDIKTVKYINNDKQQFVVYKYSDDNKLIGCFLYGFKNLHMFIREAIRYKLIPKFNYAEKNKDVLHRQITEAVLKKSDEIKCMRPLIMRNLSNINTTRYTIKDQQYTEDLMKRGLMAYNELTKKYREEDLKQQEEYDKIKQANLFGKKFDEKEKDLSKGFK